ncbi:MAG: sulfotransferase [Bacteroidia bacterium]
MIQQPKNPILVSGAHRSGSTWVGQVLSRANGLGYMHEPLNPIYPTPNKSPIHTWYFYISAHNHDRYYNFIKNTLNWNYQSGARFGGINNKYKAMMWLKYNHIFLKNKGTTPLVKDPIAFFSAPWLYEQFNAQVIMLIRHPAAFVYSLKRKDWQFPFKHLLKQDALLHDWLKNFEGEIVEFSKNQKDIIEQACLVWRIIYATLKQYQQQYKQWIYLKHEDISANPLNEFETLFKQLSLDFDNKVKEYIVSSSSASNPKGTNADEEQLKRDSSSNIKYWKNKMSADEINRIRELTQDVWPLYYDETSW